MQRHRQSFDMEGFRSARPKNLHIVRQVEMPGYPVCRVVVAVQQANRNARLAQTPHLPDEKLARIVVPPVAVIEVPGNHKEIDTLFDGQVNQPVERVPCGAANAYGGGIVRQGQVLQRAVEVNVGSVKETKGAHVSSAVPCRRHSQ